MPLIALLTSVVPLLQLWLVDSAIFSTDTALAVICLAVMAISSEVVVTCCTAAACSDEPDDCWMLIAIISLAELER